MKITNKNNICSFCEAKTGPSTIDGTCIFHCKKDNWYSVVDGRKVWDRVLVNSFWKSLEAHKILKKDFTFIKFIFPEFLENWRYCFDNGKEIIFYDCVFLDRALFSDVVFINRTIFDKTVFTGASIFFRSIFKKETSFRDAVFYDEADFTQVKCEKECTSWSFDKTVFKESVSFHSAKFDTMTMFTLTSVVNIADFTMANFKTIYFLDTNFNAFKFFGTQFNEYALFSGVQFTTGVFQKVDFSNIYLSSNLNIEEISIIECRFRIYKNRPITLVEHIKQNGLENKYIQNTLFGMHLSYEEAENVYKQIKKSFERRRDDYMSDLFYEGEMEMRLKRLNLTSLTLSQKYQNKFVKNIHSLFAHGFFERILLYIYTRVSRCGNSPGRVLKYIFIFIFLFSLVFLLISNDSNITQSLEKSIVYFIPILPKFELLNLNPPSPAIRWIYYLEVIVSTSLWTLFLFSLSRKLRR